MQYTTNYNLAKPQASDNIETTSRTALNTSMDTIDTQLKANANDIDSLETQMVGVEQKTLLWTNASPTSSFAPQTLTLGLSNYDYVEIECLFSNGLTSPRNISKVSVGSGIWLQVNQFDLSKTTVTGVMNDAFRYASITTSGITFNDGNQRYDDNLYKEWPVRCVPYKIYGIKVVS